MKNLCKISALILFASLVSGCQTTAERLSRVGKEPDLAEIKNPQEDPKYKQLSWPMPQENQVAGRNANSLWQPGSRAFFKDQRARNVGDILRVKVTIDDQAQIDNKTETTRQNSENVGAPNFMGLENVITALPGSQNKNSLVNVNSDKQVTGDGKIDRKEKIETEVAAIVTQILPNGNMVIQGKQEIRINAEVREVGIAGVVRPEDIASDNTIKSTQIAEARIIYGGRGTLSDVQQPRYGSQIIDILSPF